MQGVDIFCEHIVKRGATAPILLKVLLLCIAILGAPLGILFLLKNMQVFVVCLGLSVWGGYYLVRQCFEEYEYIFTNGELDFDKISGKQKRKRLVTVDIARTKLLLPNRAEYAEKIRRYDIVKTFDCTSQNLRNRAMQYVLIVGGKLGNAKILFEPSEELLLCIEQFARTSGGSYDRD